MREVRVSANTQGRSLGEIVADIQARLPALGIPAGYSVTFTGEWEQLKETFGYVGQSLLLAVILIYAILAPQFRGLLQMVKDPYLQHFVGLEGSLPKSSPVAESRHRQARACAVTDSNLRKAPSKIRRFDLMREVRVSANTQGHSLGEIVADVDDRADPADGLVTKNAILAAQGRRLRPLVEARGAGAGAGGGERGDRRPENVPSVPGFHVGGSRFVTMGEVQVP